ncbi:hypothetical protein AgCh_013184 [Apium graveolens]
MDRTKLPIRKRLGDVPQFSRSIDAVVAEGSSQVIEVISLIPPLKRDVLEDIGRVQRELLLNKSLFTFVVYLNSHLNVGISFIPGVSLYGYHALGLTLHILEARLLPRLGQPVPWNSESLAT